MFVDMEHEVMDFWEKEKCFEKLREKNRGHKMFRFLDGPITANNPMGIHHAWGRSIKDIFIRYHAMQGCDCRYQNGFDSQGLWVEVEVEKALGFKTKRILKTTVWTSLQKLVKTVSSIFRGLLPNSPNDSANGWIGIIPTILIPMKI